MKHIPLILTALFLAFILVGCANAERTDTGGDTDIGGLFLDIIHGIRGDTPQQETPEFIVTIRNDTAADIIELGISWTVNGNVLGSQGVSRADLSPFETGDTFSFTFYPEDLPSDNTDALQLRIKAATASGIEYDPCGEFTLYKPDTGGEYQFSLRGANGSFSVVLLPRTAESQG